MVAGWSSSGKELAIPLIVFEGPPMDTDTKRQLVRDFAEAASKATGLPAKIITTVIHENPRENIGTGPRLLTDKLADTSS